MLSPEKKNYVPNPKIEYVDDGGRVLNTKEVRHTWYLRCHFSANLNYVLLASIHRTLVCGSMVMNFDLRGTWCGSMVVHW